MQRKIIHYVSAMLETTGIHVSKDPEHREVNNTWRLIICFVLISGAAISLSIFSILNRDSFNKFILPVSYVAGVFIILGITSIVYHHRHIIGEMLHLMDNNLYHYPDQHFMNVKYKWYLEENNVRIIILGVLYCQIAFVFLLCLPSILELAFYGEINSYVYPAWTPWKTDKWNLQLLTLMIQIIQAVCGFWLNYIIMVLIFVVITEFLRQFERLNVALRSLKQDDIDFTLSTMVDHSKLPNQFSNEIVKERILHCIKHHQMLLKNFHLFRIWFSVFFAWEFAICVLSFAFGLYVLLNAPSIGEMVNYVAVASAISVNILTRCIMGEVLLNLNDGVKSILFSEIEWCRMNKENRQLLLMFHLTLCRPFYLFGFSIIEVTLATFASIIRVTYTSFNMINASIKK